MSRPIVDHCRRSLLRVGAGPHDIESMVTEKERCASRESLGFGSVEHFDFDPHSFRRFCVVGYVGRSRASCVQRPYTEPDDRSDHEQGENESSVATLGARYRRLFQSSTVSGKM